MQELYALPDHIVVAQLLPDVDSRPLSRADARDRIKKSPGIVPIAIDPENGGKIYWADFGTYPFREWQYIFTVRHLALAGALQSTFVSQIDILLEDDLFADGIKPQGFIFHVSRCGSTLLGKSLARVDENLVINQGAPLQHGFWACLSESWSKPLRDDDQAVRMFRNLILAMTRPRLPEYRRAFVKFISWNTLYLDFVMKAWPGVKALFLYRDPVEVIASVKKATTAALVAKPTKQAQFLIGSEGGEPQDLNDVSYLAHCYAHYFRHVQKIMHQDLAIVEYRDIAADNLNIILRDALGYQPDKDALSLMKEQFQFHSKDDHGKARFASDSVEKHALMSEEEKETIDLICGGLMRDLGRSPGNLFLHTAGAV